MGSGTVEPKSGFAMLAAGEGVGAAPKAPKGEGVEGAGALKLMPVPEPNAGAADPAPKIDGFDPEPNVGIFETKGLPEGFACDDSPAFSVFG